MNENKNSEQMLQELVFSFEALIDKGEIGTFNKDEFEQLINFYTNNNNIYKALEITELAIEQFKYIVDFYLLKSELLLINREADLALANIIHCEELSPYSSEVKLLKAKALSMKGETTKVTELLKELKSFSRLNFNTEFSIINSYLYEYSGDYERMFYSLKEALIIDPSSKEALDRIYSATFLTKKYEESLVFHMKLIDDSPYNYLAWYNLGLLYSTVAEYENAIDSFEYSFIINTNFEQGYLHYGDLCMQTGKYLKAIIVYEEYIEKFEADSEVYTNIIQCYINLKKYKKAKDFAYLSIKVDPFNDEAYYMLGQIFRRVRNWKQALNAFNKAMELDEEREDYIDAVAEMYIKLNDLKKAEQYYDILIDTCTPEEQYYIKYVLFLMENKKYKKALQVIKYSEEATYSPLFNYLKALIKFRQNSPKEGLMLLDSALSESVEDYKTFFKWAPDLKNDKDVISAINYYR